MQFRQTFWIEHSILEFKLRTSELKILRLPIGLKADKELTVFDMLQGLGTETIISIKLTAKGYVQYC